MKRKYERPMAYEEVFIADQSVAACYYLACERETRKDLVIEGKWHSHEYGPDTSHANGYKKIPVQILLLTVLFQIQDFYMDHKLGNTIGNRVGSLVVSTAGRIRTIIISWMLEKSFTGTL